MSTLSISNSLAILYRFSAHVGCWESHKRSCRSKQATSVTQNWHFTTISAGRSVVWHWREAYFVLWPYSSWHGIVPQSAYQWRIGACCVTRDIWQPVSASADVNFRACLIWKTIGLSLLLTRVPATLIEEQPIVYSTFFVKDFWTFQRKERNYGWTWPSAYMFY